MQAAFSSLVAGVLGGSRRGRRFLVAFSLGAAPAVTAQIPVLPPRYAVNLRDDTLPPPLPREFRGIWVATVSNMDWPSRPGLSTSEQKAELLGILDRAVARGFNAIVFQIRPSADALYESPYEPWSAVLTGAMGKAPSPFYDPLAFAVAEAHKRGLELHAWFNPYRARYANERGKAARNHVTRTMPSVVKRYGRFLWMDPGEPAVLAQTVKVIVDVVRRYDIDAVHLDDYFYPYPERDRRGRVLDFPDSRSWTRYVKGGGALDRDDWRRQNVDRLVETLQREIHKAKPWVRFGVSPFGIWRPGYPEVARGFDQYGELFADPRKWLAQGWLDYVSPQLYWRVGAPQQPYVALLEWWAQQNVKGRHLWPGNADYKVAPSGEQWSASEITNQIRLTRDEPGVGGNVHFNESAVASSYDDLAARLAAGPYSTPALPPATPWLSTGTPAAPVVTRADAPNGVRLRINVGAAATPSSVPRWWLVRARYPDGWHALVLDAVSRVMILAPDLGGQLPELVAVSTVDRVGVESEPVVIVPAAVAK